MVTSLQCYPEEVLDLFGLVRTNRVGLGGQVAFAVRNKYDLFPRNLGLVGLRITF